MPVNGKLWNYGGYVLGVLWIARQVQEDVNRGKKQSEKLGDGGAPGEKKKSVPYLTYSKDITRLLQVCFPTWKCQESLVFYSFVLVLLLRTVLSVIVADIDGYMVKQLINRDRRRILWGVATWVLISFPSSLINALIKYLQARLAMGLRRRLTNWVRDLYFANETYFRVSHLDKRIANPEHAMTEDVSQWAERLADLASTYGKPMIDLMFYSAFLIKTLGFTNQFLASVVVWESSKFLKFVRPNYADLVQKRGTLEANLRFQHTRVITASEEIAFSRGEEREKSILMQHFDKIMTFTSSMLKSQIPYHTFEDFLTKYLWTVVGIAQVAYPLMNSNMKAGDSAKFFITMRRLMVRNGDACERLLVGVREMHEFKGFTKRVMDMVRVFEEQKTLAEQSSGRGNMTLGSDDIIVKDLPIVTPTGDLLIEKMNLRLSPSDRLLILGPNGCGKSSLFRILCGLWPMHGGEISKPSERKDLYFLPQKPYMVQGTLRDQIIYPLTREEMASVGRTDDDVRTILSWVLLTPVSEHHGGLDAVKEWAEVLSGGEKQRVGIARIFFHKPKYAILDECSSAINIEAEHVIFDHLVKSGIGLITISHRHTLFKFHNKVLTFDGEGGYHFDDQLKETQLVDLSKKKDDMMRQLHDVLRELGEDWPAKYAQPAAL